MSQTASPSRRPASPPSGGILALPPAKALLLVLGALAVQAGVLYAMGMAPICTCGRVDLWHGAVASPENSQHLTDWYTFTHVVHGFIFYGLAWLAFPRASVWFRLVLAVAVECGWEIVENTPLVIERYRAGAVSLGYFGDSIVNSLGDTLAMIAGALIAMVLPVWATVALALGSEIALGFIIRDNLALNVILLLYPIDAVLKWQAGA